MSPPDPDRIASLEHSGLVNPSDLVAEPFASELTAANLFRKPPDGLSSFKGLSKQDLPGYARLVARDLRSGKLQLQDTVRAGGTVFTVPKADGTLREVWHGTRPSQAAGAPPQPTHLANPEALARISLLPNERLWGSKRDCRSLFDQLRAPDDLRPFFGRPSLCVRELLGAGMAMDELEDHWCGEGQLGAESVVWPVSCVWPMGFSWSSYVAQGTMLATMRKSGRTEKEMVSLQQPIPSANRDLSALATDDVIHLTTLGPAHSVRTMSDFELACRQSRIELNQRKSVTGVQDMTLIGIRLRSGRFLGPDPNKLSRFTRAVVYLFGTSDEFELSPNQLAALSGVGTWFCLLNRPLLCVLEKSYSFGRGDCPNTPRPVSRAVKKELMTLVSMLCFAESDLGLPWFPGIMATDASPAFGYGVCLARTSQSKARRYGLGCFTADALADFESDDEDPVVAEKLRARLGTRCTLPVRRHQFRTLLSARARETGHSGFLELTGVELGLNLFVRSSEHLRHRLNILIDAQAVLRAVLKGRSSAPTFYTGLRRINATLLACTIRLGVSYVPSEANPADPPSRGVVAPRTESGQQLRRRQEEERDARCRERRERWWQDHFGSATASL